MKVSILTNQGADVNPGEIAAHVEDDSLLEWCNAWRQQAIKIVKSLCK